MKRLVLVWFVSGVSTQMFCAQTPPTVWVPPITINNNNHNYNLSQSVSKAMSEVFNSNHITTLQTCIREAYQNGMLHSKAFFAQYRYYLFVSSVIGFYGVVVAYLIYLSRVYKNLYWAHWNRDDMFVSYDQHGALTQLMRAIQEQYIDPREPQNYFIPLSRFLSVLEYEESFVRWYIKLDSCVRGLRIDYLPAIRLTNSVQLQQSLEHLVAIKKLFMHWCIEKNNQAIFN